MEHHHSPIDQRDRLAEILDEVELVAREQHVASLGDVVEHDLRQELHGAGVEPGERLVEHDQIGPVHHRRRQLHPLGHPTRQVADRVAGTVLETEPGEQVERPLLCHPLVESVQPCDPHEVVGDTHVAVEPPLLGHVAPRPPVLGGGTSALPLDRAGIRIEHAEDDPHQAWSCRPRSGRADRSPVPAGTSRSTLSSTTRSPNRWDTPRTTSESVISPPCHPASVDVEHRPADVPNPQLEVTYGEACARTPPDRPLRHGETAWSANRRHTGRSDIPLDAEGRASAAAVADLLRGWDFALVLSSPLSRAWDTARLAGLDPVPDDDLLEWDYGEYEGLATEEIRTAIPGLVGVDPRRRRR